MNEETWRVCGNSKQLEKDLCGWGENLVGRMLQRSGDEGKLGSDHIPTAKPGQGV